MMSGRVLAQDNCKGECIQGTETGDACPTDCGDIRFPNCAFYDSPGEPTGECCYCDGSVFKCQTCKVPGKNATDEDVDEDAVVAPADEEAQVDAMETKDESGASSTAITFAAATAVV